MLSNLKIHVHCDQEPLRWPPKTPASWDSLSWVTPPAECGLNLMTHFQDKKTSAFCLSYPLMEAYPSVSWEEASAKVLREAAMNSGALGPSHQQPRGTSSCQGPGRRPQKWVLHAEPSDKLRPQMTPWLLPCEGRGTQVSCTCVSYPQK